MKTEKTNITYLIAGPLFIIFLVGGVISAINNLNEGWRVHEGTTERVFVYDDCRDISSGSGDIFVPTGTQTEWDLFKDNPPPETSLGVCGQCVVGGTPSDINLSGIPYRVLTFTTSQNVRVDCNGIDIEYLIVGGGGGGGGRGGGGGGGGIRAGTMLATGGIHPVVIGVGGNGCISTGGASCSIWPSNGLTSSVFGILASGGGAGGNYNGGVGYSGGSGGGAGAKNCENTGTSLGGGGVVGQGYNGGETPQRRMGGGGGGGGGGPGGASSGPTNYPDNCTAAHSAGAGGIGFYTTIRGYGERFAGGGGGGGSANVSGGAGGSGGGGNGKGGAGALNRGGGGGGGGSSSGNWGNSGPGGSGIVILRYRTSDHTVTFNANGGSGHSPATKNIRYGHPVGVLPSNPTRAGYIFAGWFSAVTGGTQITTGTQILGDVTYYARWNITGVWETSGWSACSASPTWVATSSWSTCSRSCGGGTQSRSRTCQNTSGTQTRTVICRLTDGNIGTDSQCSGAGPKPSESQSCTEGCIGSTTETRDCNTSNCYGRWQHSGGFTSCNNLGTNAIRCYNGAHCNVGYGNTCGYYHNGVSTTWWPSGVAQTITCRVYTNSSCTNPF